MGVPSSVDPPRLQLRSRPFGHLPRPRRKVPPYSQSAFPERPIVNRPTARPRPQGQQGRAQFTVLAPNPQLFHRPALFGTKPYATPLPAPDLEMARSAWRRAIQSASRSQPPPPRPAAKPKASKPKTRSPADDRSKASGLTFKRRQSTACRNPE